MADDGAAAESSQESEDAPAEATKDHAPQCPDVAMEYVDRLPGGRAVMPMEREGSFTWLVVRGHISPQARTEMLGDLRHIVRSGLWVQNWQPPQAD